MLISLAVFVSFVSASPQDVLDAALSRHPEVRTAEARLRQAVAAEGTAAQRPNPELEGKATFASGAEDSEASLLHTLELGGKRRARRELAGAERAVAEAGLLAAKEEVALRTVGSLYRLRQARAELRLLDETLSAFRRIQRQLRSRPRLAPEQEVSLAVFDLAQRDARLRRASLEAEEAELLAWLRPVAAGEPSLPERRAAWPALPEASEGSASVLAARAAALAARGELSQARGQAWPDLKLGPSLSREKDDGGTRSTYGVGFSVPLPLFQRNAAGRKQAKLGVEAAQLSLEQLTAALKAEREAEAARYTAAVKALAEASSDEAFESTHKTVEDLAARGLIPSSLVIEAHRQLFDFTKDLHEAELAAVQALWRIHALDGRILQEKL